MSVGILALQGDYQAHHDRLVELGQAPLYIRRAQELAALNGLVIPGGESTAMLKLMDHGFREALSSAVNGGMCVLATCAGVVLLARQVTNPAQQSLGLLDVDVERNAYGRQLDSFVEENLEWTSAGHTLLEKSSDPAMRPENNLEAVFIRAPKMARTGEQVEVLAKSRGEPVFVKQQNIYAACFHPELGKNSVAAHRLFLASCASL